MEFKTLNIIKHPPEKVWVTMRDQFPDIVELVEEVDSVVVDSRTEISKGIMEVKNIWKANPPIPEVIIKHVKPEMLTWTDTALWDEQTMICSWKIDSHYFKEKMDCKGITKFEPAIGGRGCRLTFEGTIHWEGGIPLSFGMMDGMVSKALESIISKMVPNNFRKVTSGVEMFMAKQEA
jgi:polyketide cyclase/dehydrase/lipid transport protein